MSLHISALPKLSILFHINRLKMLDNPLYQAIICLLILDTLHPISPIIKSKGNKRTPSVAQIISPITTAIAHLVKLPTMLISLLITPTWPQTPIITHIKQVPSPPKPTISHQPHLNMSHQPTTTDTQQMVINHISINMQQVI